MASTVRWQALWQDKVLLASYGRRCAGAALLLLPLWLLLYPDISSGDAVVPLILAVTASGLVFWRLLNADNAADSAATERSARTVAVVLLSLGAVCAAGASLAGEQRLTMVAIALALLALGATTAACGRAVAASITVPVLVLCIAVPLLPLSEAVLSYPMRRLCALLAAMLLALGSRDVSVVGTEIYFGDLTVSVTSACDGLTLLQNLAWIAWWTVLLRYQGFWLRLGHGLIAVPAVIVANTLRIVILALWAATEGPQVLASAGHLYIAWASVALATALFLGFQGVYPEQVAATDRCTTPCVGRQPD